MSELHKLQLVGGLELERQGGSPVLLKTVVLAEARERHIHQALKSVQELRRDPTGRVVLVHNEALFEAARVAAQIESIGSETEGLVLRQPDIDINLLGKLHPLDVALINERLMELELAAQRRWGLISEDSYNLAQQSKRLATGAPPTPEQLLLVLRELLVMLAKNLNVSLDELEQKPLSELHATLNALVKLSKG